MCKNFFEICPYGHAEIAIEKAERCYDSIGSGIPGHLCPLNRCTWTIITVPEKCASCLSLPHDDTPETAETKDGSQHDELDAAEKGETSRPEDLCQRRSPFIVFDSALTSTNTEDYPDDLPAELLSLGSGNFQQYRRASWVQPTMINRPVLPPTTPDGRLQLFQTIRQGSPPIPGSDEAQERARQNCPMRVPRPSEESIEAYVKYCNEQHDLWGDAPFALYSWVKENGEPS
jgi:hypothetical protein